MTLTPTYFRCVVVASVLFAIGGAVIEGAFDLVPEALRVAEFEATPTEFTTPMLIAVVGGGAAAVAAIVGLVGLLKLRPWGRRLSLISTILLVAVYPFVGAIVVSGAAATANTISSVLWGAALAMAYFSPLSARFDG
jgi:nitrate reductase gamma subunit